MYHQQLIASSMVILRIRWVTHSIVTRSLLWLVGTGSSALAGWCVGILVVPSTAEKNPAFDGELPEFLGSELSGNGETSESSAIERWDFPVHKNHPAISWDIFGRTPPYGESMWITSRKNSPMIRLVVKNSSGRPGLRLAEGALRTHRRSPVPRYRPRVEEVGSKVSGS